MKKRENLISRLKLAISALRDGTIHYDWYKHESCNCGVVAQALLGKNREEVQKLFNPVLAGMQEYKKGSDSQINLTWKEGVGLYCPITGRSMHDIFNQLMDAGLSKADMAHLEYMSNPAILKRSGIDTSKKTKENYTKKEKKMVTKNLPKGFWRTLFMMSPKTHQVEEEIEVQKKRTVDHYQNQDNLVLYLQAWVDILGEGSKYKESSDLSELSPDELEAELINVVADENYKRAAEIRDELAETK